MDIVGQKVLHKTYGIGTIIWVGGRPQNNSIYIKVEFESKISELVFPDCFEKILTALDDDFAKTIEYELSKTTTSLKQLEKQAFTPKSVDTGIKYINTDHILKDKTLPPTCVNSLVLGHYYGTNSKNIYLNCCEWFGWDKSQAGNFGRQGALLYAKRATPEGYSPWFVTHHNLTGTKGGEWKNTINGDFIHEEWDNYDERMWDDKTTRVVFILLSGKYCFYGVYRVYKIELKENCKYTKTYQRIKENYFH